MRTMIRQGLALVPRSAPRPTVILLLRRIGEGRAVAKLLHEWGYDAIPGRSVVEIARRYDLLELPVRAVVAIGLHIENSGVELLAKIGIRVPAIFLPAPPAATAAAFPEVGPALRSLLSAFEAERRARNRHLADGDAKPIRSLRRRIPGQRRE